MTAFADSSALVKLSVPEAGHELVRERDALAVAQVARVEVPSAIWRKHRLGELSARGARVLASLSPEPVSFLCFDKQLADAAAAEGFDLG
ncbi:hypothetical protein [Amycolatopsis albispora]|uniref:PIN domain-containing protein n=1 Tax=Amycolatopsis albispora TaxID=1804986 RepID=A0A344LGG8_9PSEU|nr:hypothetical protein [Amycolatopsis albispora]AXB47142.1 hypothetical protein A4R43_35730 [Amycolatopsis albispora]